MKKYALISQNKIHSILEVDDDYEVSQSPDIKYIEITGLSPMPEVGWCYNYFDGTFNESIKLALIKDNIVQIIDTISIEYALKLGYDHVVAISGIVPEPQVGWAYDSTEETFSARITLTVYDFRQLFTLAERAAITEEGKTNSTIQAFLDDLLMAPDVDLFDPNISTALSLFVSEGLLTEARKTEILNNEAPAE